MSVPGFAEQARRKIGDADRGNPHASAGSSAIRRMSVPYFAKRQYAISGLCTTWRCTPSQSRMPTPYRSAPESNGTTHTAVSDSTSLYASWSTRARASVLESLRQYPSVLGQFALGTVWGTADNVAAGLGGYLAHSGTEKAGHTDPGPHVCGILCVCVCVRACAVEGLGLRVEAAAD
eukprot:3882010-Rhodomonas_salina.1